MEIGTASTAGLELLQSAFLSDTAYDRILSLAFKTLSGQTDTPEDLLKDPEFNGVDPIEFKQAYAALVSFILESSKNSSSAEAFSLALREQGVGETRVDSAKASYAQYLARLRDVLACTGFSLPSLVGVEWRLDYIVTSSSSGRVNQPVYFLTIITKDPARAQGGGAIGGSSDESDGIQKIEICCSLEQLQDLLYKVKSATKQLERIQNS